jgi:hypothetical protein
VPGLGSADPLFDQKVLEILAKQGVRRKSGYDVRGRSPSLRMPHIAYFHRRRKPPYRRRSGGNIGPRFV